MNQLLERLKLYEPFFNQYYIDHIVKQYDDMVWICFDNGMLMKVKTLYCQEDIEKVINHLMVDQYKITSYPNLEDSPYLNQIHYYIEENHQIIGVDLCLLSKGYILNEQTISNDKLRNVGLCYYYGSNQYVQDEYKAFELLDKASNIHDYKAMCTLGLMYERGFGVQQDLIKAIELYQLSADHGYSEAQCNIAYCYSRGIGG
ncbi:MAG: sel1 repeat family protein [Erysipelotrichaceae bacterium]|nr:sel1 repeat family protein [Erysipelotrichaceae bacterium]